MFGGNFAPAGWAFCNGQLMPISENETLFTLIGTTYGGDGEETFELPDLQGRVPLHFGRARGSPVLPDRREGWSREVTLTVSRCRPQPCALAPTIPATAGPVGTCVAQPVNRTYFPAAGRQLNAQRFSLSRRQPAARQPAALSCASATSSRCSVSSRQQRRSTPCRSVRRRNPHFRVQLPPPRAGRV